MEHLDANQNQIKADLRAEPAAQQVNNSQLGGLEFRGHPQGWYQRAGSCSRVTSLTSIWA